MEKQIEPREACEEYLKKAYGQLDTLGEAKPIKTLPAIFAGIRTLRENQAHPEILSRLPLIKDLLDATRNFPVHPNVGFAGIDLNFGVLLSSEGKSTTPTIESKVVALEDLARIWKDAPPVVREYIEATVNYLFRSVWRDNETKWELFDQMKTARLDMRAYEAELRSNGKDLPDDFNPDRLYGLVYYAYPEHNTMPIGYSVGYQIREVGNMAGESSGFKGDRDIDTMILDLIGKRYPKEIWVAEERARLAT